MIYLGINVSHNASACLMIDGEIKLAPQEERFTAIKNFTGYPKQSIDYCLDYVRKLKKKIDVAAFSTIYQPAFAYRVPLNHFFSIPDFDDFYGEKYYSKKLKLGNTTSYIDKLLKDKRNKENLYLPFKEINKKQLFNDLKILNKLMIKYLIEQSKGIIKNYQIIDHHTCHAHYAYYASNIKEKKSAIITLDSVGDNCNQTVWISNKKNGGITKVTQSLQCDLARIYKFVTLILSMKPDEHEYKVMGLAPYAKKEYLIKLYKEVFENILQVKNCRVIHKNRPKDLYLYLKTKLSNNRFDNIAGAAQLLIEEVSKKLLKQIYLKYKIRNFCISGGVSMNVKMNKALSELKFVKNLYVPPSGSDESLAIGACYYLNKNKSKFLKNIYLGQNIDGYRKNPNYLKKIFSKKKYIIKKTTHKQIAKMLNSGKIIAVVRGREEFGARALGNRSILANPSKRNVVQEINELIKNRDFWMPFALTIIKEQHKKYLINKKNIECDFMTIAFDTLPKNFEKIRSGTHPYDKTVRPQILCKDFNPNYYNIIKEFFNITRIPALLNTSYNLHGYPISSTMRQILFTFQNSGLKYLYINDKYLIEKK